MCSYKERGRDIFIVIIIINECDVRQAQIYVISKDGVGSGQTVVPMVLVKQNVGWNNMKHCVSLMKGHWSERPSLV